MNHPAGASRGADVPPSPGLSAASRRGRSAAPRRLAASALGLLLVLAAVGVTTTPAGAAVPGAPTPIRAFGYAGGIHVYFAPPLDNGGHAVSTYFILRTINNGMPQIAAVFHQPDTAAFIDTSAVPGKQYRYIIEAENSDGKSAPSAALIATRPTVIVTDYTKFHGSIQLFVDRQFQDFLGRAPSAGELATAVTQLQTNTSPSSFISKLVNLPGRDARHQVGRLYFAYFKRGPDHGGLAYWDHQIRAHIKGLQDVSDNFATSNEFKTTYGSLSNLDFITLVYQNVLGRMPDVNGLAYWQAHLDGGSVSRGRMMTKFSESNEFQVASKGRVLASDVWDAMTGSAIPTGDLPPLARHIQGGGTAGDVATLIITLPVYVV